MAKRATMVDIALKAGVSQATVSLVLSEVPNARVSAETRARVKDIAQSLGYKRKSRAPSGGVRVIGLLIDEVTTTPFAAPLIEGARDAAAAAGIMVAVFCTGADVQSELAALDVLSQTNLVGVLYACLVTRAVTPPERLRQAPAVLLNCHGIGLPSVVPADTAGAFGAVQLLIDSGHRRIAHISGEEWIEATRDRIKGYRQALATADLPFDPELLVGPAWTVDGGRAMTERLLALPAPPTAIFCFNDRAAVGCYEALQQKGLRVPEDMSVVGFDNEDFVANLAPPLSTMILPHDEMARWAVEALIEGQGQPWPPIHPRRVKIDCAPVRRLSIAAPRKPV